MHIVAMGTHHSVHTKFFNQNLGGMVTPIQRHRTESFQPINRYSTNSGGSRTRAIYEYVKWLVAEGLGGRFDGSLLDDVNLKYFSGDAR